MSCAALALKVKGAPNIGQKGLEGVEAVQHARCGQLDREQRDAIVMSHLPLVRAIAGRVRENLPVQVELDDLVHAGILGLFDAVQKYDPSKRVVFHLYAKHRIRGAILDSLRQLDWASRDLRKRYKYIEAMTQRLSYQLGRAPTEAELAREMGVNLTRWRKLSLELHAAGLGTPQSHVSGAYAETLDRHIAAEAPHSEEELPDKVCAHRQLQSVLATALRTLPVRYQRVVALYYSQGATMRQIGNELGVNESRVSQIHKAALEKLNLALRSRGIGGADMFVGQ
jgi:RNA polymerase sigma factor for flagellar operon FliA